MTAPRRHRAIRVFVPFAVVAWAQLLRSDPSSAELTFAAVVTLATLGLVLLVVGDDASRPHPDAGDQSTVDLR